MYVADHFLLRIAGASFETASRLRQELPLALWHALDDLDSDLGATTESLAQTFFDHVASETDLEVKNALIRARRSIVSLRRPSPRDVALLRSSLKAENPSRIGLEIWFDRIADLEALRAKISQAVLGLPDDWATALREISKSDRFLRSLWLANSQVYRDIAHINEGTLPSRGRIWKDFLTAGSYANRMAYKTGPFGLFTTIACGCFAEGSARALESPFAIRQRVGLKCGVVGEIADILQRHASGFSQCPLLLNETIIETGDELRFLPVRSRAAGVYQENWLVIKRGPAVDAVVRELNSSSNLVYHFSQLAKRLAEQTAGEDSRSRIEDYLLELLRIDFLRFETRIERNPFDPFADLCRSIEADDPVLMSNAKVVLSELHEVVSALTVAPQASWPMIETTLVSKLRYLGLSDSSHTQNMNFSGVIHARCLAEERIDLDAGLITPYEDNLGSIAKLVPLFDLEFGRRLDTRAFSIDKCRNRPQGFLELYLEYQNHLEAGTLFEPLHPLHIEHRAVRAQLVTYLRELARSELPTVEFPKAIISSYGDLGSHFLLAPFGLSVAFQGQLSFERQEPKFVINDVVPGFGALIGTFADDELRWATWLSSSLNKAISREMRGMECVNVNAVLGFDGQIHSSPFKRSIVFPSRYRPGKTAAEIALRQLSIRTTPDNRHPELVVNGEDEPIIPILSGSLSPRLLPPLVRFLGGFGCYQAPFMRLVDWFEAEIDDRESGRTRHYARIVFDNVVIERETWCIPIEMIPGLRQKDLSVDSYRELVRWKEHERLPDRIFVRTLAGPSMSRSTVRRKPFYLDWSDMRCVSQFHRSMRTCRGVLIVSELLPSDQSALIRTESGSHAAEFHIEIYAGGGLRDAVK